MKLKIKQKGMFGPSRSAHTGEFKEVTIARSVDSDKSTVKIAFKGKTSSGLLELSKEEFLAIFSAIGE
jgi:hypothetical protein